MVIIRDDHICSPLPVRCPPWFLQLYQNSKFWFIMAPTFQQLVWRSRCRGLAVAGGVAWRQSDVCHNYLIWPPYLSILDQIIMATLIFTKLYRFQCLWWYRAPYNFCFRFSGQFGNREEALKFYRLLHCLFVKIKSQLYFSLFMPAFIVPVWILLSVNHILL